MLIKELVHEHLYLVISPFAEGGPVCPKFLLKFV